MNLQQTIQSLEENNITVASDVGVHRYCDINSNCPLAVELRRYIHDSGVTLEQLLEGFAASEEHPPELEGNGNIEFDDRVAIKIGSQEIALNFNDIIGDQLQVIVARKLRDLESLQDRVVDTGRSLYDTYLNEIYRLRQTDSLPQLYFSIGESIKAGCLITAESDKYIFLFPRHYKPQWIVTEGVRYKIASKDIKAIENDIYIRFIISGEAKIINTRILNKEGDNFQHYHGRLGDDCWGHVIIPRKWDKTLRSLTDLVTLLMGSLVTINKDSLMQSKPPYVPHIEDVFQRSTKLGEEGQVEERERPEGNWDTERNRVEGEPIPARRWGQREVIEANTELRIIGQERMRRFDMRGAPRDR